MDDIELQLQTLSGKKIAIAWVATATKSDNSATVTEARADRH